jgi:hypothetical protein
MFSFLEGRVLEQSPDCPIEALADPWAGGIDVPDDVGDPGVNVG